MTTLPYGEWCKKEQAELAQVHKGYMTRLDEDKTVKAKYAATSEEYKKDHEAKLKADTAIKAKYAATSEQYRKQHLDHLKQG